MHLNNACKPLSCVHNLLLASSHSPNKSDVRRKGRRTISISKVINLLLQLTTQFACVSQLHCVCTANVGRAWHTTALAESPVGSTHTEYVEAIWTCSFAAFLAVTSLRAGRRASDRPMSTAAQRISTTLAAAVKMHIELGNREHRRTESKPHSMQKDTNKIFSSPAQNASLLV